MSRENIYKGVATVSLAVGGISSLVLLADGLCKSFGDKPSMNLVEFATGGLLLGSTALGVYFMNNKRIREYRVDTEADSVLSRTDKPYEEH